ncbi:MAG: hypothetical protein HYU36_11990 [Planctomycetes bacterium]|nr:hypothetical protein [Planctomycetota bacterium]
MITIPLFSSEVNLTRAGGKAASLAGLGRAGFPVPPGFVVTTDAYRQFLRAHGLDSQVMELARRAAADDASSLEWRECMPRPPISSSACGRRLGAPFALLSLHGPFGACGSLPVCASLRNFLSFISSAFIGPRCWTAEHDWPSKVIWKGRTIFSTCRWKPSGSLLQVTKLT